jgi:hypothetical protein
MMASCPGPEANNLLVNLGPISALQIPKTRGLYAGIVRMTKHNEFGCRKPILVNGFSNLSLYSFTCKIVVKIHLTIMSSYIQGS